ncbi:MAG: 50S ribosomal protein L24 [Acidobacteria bacterium]|nr:50S ribosomal protein L24 [Acidobacteriota bacterium]
MQKIHIKRNDTVQVLSGKDKGKSGRVLRVYPDTQRALVEKINMIYAHVRPNPQKNIQGGIVQKENPIHVSKLMVVCPSCKQSTRIGHSILTDGTKVRICKKCDANIDK